MSYQCKNNRRGRAAKRWYPMKTSGISQVAIHPADLLMMGSPSILKTQGVSPAVFEQIGVMTRQILNTMKDIGVMPRLESVAFELPDARSRLNYIVEKTTDAANKVLNLVDEAKEEQQSIERLCADLEAWAAKAGLSDEQLAGLNQISESMVGSTQKLGGQLTDIMMAQDFHDLTGQVVKKVVSLAVSLEEDLVSLFMKIAPSSPEEVEAARKAKEDKQNEGLQGPVVDKEKSDVATDQSEVDDLLASLGF